jgi:hypothetical protein
MAGTLLQVALNQAADQRVCIEFVFGRHAKGQRMLGLHGRDLEKKMLKMRFDSR